MKPARTSRATLHIAPILNSVSRTWSRACLLVLVVLLAGCGNSQESARQGLTKLGKDFSPVVFIQCVDNGDKEAVRLFIEAGMNVNTPIEGGLTALNVAAMKGNSELVKALLDKGANPDAAMTSGEAEGATPLMMAAIGGHVEVGNLLLAKGADVHAKDAHDLCAVDYANTNRAVLELLWKHGAPVITTAAMNKLFENTDREVYGIVIDNLIAGKSPDASRKLVVEQLANFQDRLKFTPGQMLAGRVRIFGSAFRAIEKFDMEERIDASGRGGDAKKRETISQFVEWLKELQADPVLQLELLVYASKENGYMAKWLLDQGAKVNGKTVEGLTPLCAAIRANEKHIVELLLSCGADVNQKGDGELTPVMWAAGRGRTAILKVLLEKKPDLSATAASGVTALQMARKFNETEAAALLRDAGGKE